MVHFHFVRKQLSICVKITAIVVFSFFILGRYIFRSKKGTEREQERDRTTDELRHSGSLNVHCWHSICGSNIDSLTRHVLFPIHPHQRTSITSLRMRTKLQNFGQRIFGYIHPPSSGTYQFSVSSDDLAEVLAEVWLSSDEIPENTKLICQVGDVHERNLTTGFTKPGEYDKYENQTSRSINLNGGKKYFIEVLHKKGPSREGHLEVAWKLPGRKNFTVISSEFISLYSKQERNKSDNVTFPKIIPKHHKNTPTKYHRRFWNYTHLPDTDAIPLLRHSHKALPACKTKALKEKITRYSSTYYVTWPSVFPEDGSNLILEKCQFEKNRPQRSFECKGNGIIQREKAFYIVEKYLNISFAGKYFLESIIRLEDGIEKHSKDHRYFIEIEVVDKASGKKGRIAEYVVEDHVDKKLCYPTETSWNPDATIYVIVTAKDQGNWLCHFVDNMVDIQEQTNNENIHTIIVDFGSEDVDINSYLQHSRLKNYKVIHKEGSFYKTAAINEAAAFVKDNNSIIFLLDLHLDVPINLFETVRKHTVQGYLAFVPLLTRLMCGSSSDSPKGHWEAEGFGLFAIYKSDWIRFGGMNEKEFGHNWGGEDSEMMDRVIIANIRVHKLNIPGLFHFFHDKKGLWKKSR